MSNEDIAKEVRPETYQKSNRRPEKHIPISAGKRLGNNSSQKMENACEGPKTGLPHSNCFTQ